MHQTDAVSRRNKITADHEFEKERAETHCWWTGKKGHLGDLRKLSDELLFWSFF